MRPVINSVAVHPLQPHLVAVGTHVGSYLLRFRESFPLLPFLALPLTTPWQALAGTDEGLEGASANYVAVVGNKVHCITVSATQQVRSLCPATQSHPQMHCVMASAT
jgi:hypothetical protein